MMFWYHNSWVTMLLLPFSWLYRAIIRMRRWCYDNRWFLKYRSKAPVIVVGNLTVGGTGKTPVVIELAKQLADMGYKPGVVSRGYGGRAPQYPFIVTKQADVNHSGDEPLLIAQKTDCPVVVDPDRPRAASHLLDNFHCNIILSDDGLQHYALERDVEIVVQDPQRGNGNNHCLPAGPLREPIKRLESVDFVLTHIDAKLDCIYSLNNPDKKISITEFKRVHAVCGIGNPEKFFALLRAHNIDVIEHPKTDHHHFTQEDFQFDDDYAIIITEKDAVKCHRFGLKNCWVLAIAVELPEKLFTGLQKHLHRPQRKHL